MNAARPIETHVPLCVDLDGTLIRTDLLHEGLIAFVKQHPYQAWRLPLWLVQGRATLKARLAERVDFSAAALPYRTKLVEHLRDERSRGRQVHLVTATPSAWAEAVAAHLDLFDAVEGTGSINLKGHAKAAHLRDRHGEQGFDYVGDHRVDLPVWRAARLTLRAGRAARLVTGLPDERHGQVFADEGRGTLAAIVKAIRPHQWLKNLLILVPLLASHRVGEPALVVRGLLAFAAFSLLASATYLINDMLDLEADRLHPRKRLRPFASGDLPLAIGLALIVALGLGSLLIALVLPLPFGLALAVYTAVTLAYSFRLKRAALVDVIALGGLYTLRIVAGALALAIPASAWLLAFSMFTFVSLAIAKRIAELTAGVSTPGAKVVGRGYYDVDLEILGSMGSSASFCAVLVLAIYTTQDYVARLYRSPDLLWLMCPLLLYWLNRILLLARRGQMTDDPIVFTISDKVSRATLAVCGAIVIAAAIAPFNLNIIGK